MPGPLSERRVESVDGVALSVREHSRPGPGKPHLVLVHGYPDQQDMWDPLIASLDGAALHIVTYDVRGAGGSDVPPETSGYRTELLVEDLLAVVAATVPDTEPFHLVGHDWGSVQLWDVVAAERRDDRLHGRVASFTSISGPSLDHMAHLSRHHEGRRLRMLRQAAHSWYVYAFHVPVLPELAWRGGGRVLGAMSTVLGRRSDHPPWGPELSRNAVNGLGLYRANVRRRLVEAQDLRVDVPVQVIVPTRDRFVTDVTLDDLDQACRHLTVVRVDAGHWVPRTHPRRIAELVTAHARAHSG